MFRAPHWLLRSWRYWGNLDLDGKVRSIGDPARPDAGACGSLIVDIGAYEFGAELPLDVWTKTWAVECITL